MKPAIQLVFPENAFSRHTIILYTRKSQCIWSKVCVCMKWGSALRMLGKRKKNCSVHPLCMYIYTGINGSWSTVYVHSGSVFPLQMCTEPVVVAKSFGHNHQNFCRYRCVPRYRIVGVWLTKLAVLCGEVGGWGRDPFSRNLMSPTPRRKWYLTTARRAH